MLPARRRASAAAWPVCLLATLPGFPGRRRPHAVPLGTAGASASASASLRLCLCLFPIIVDPPTLRQAGRHILPVPCWFECRVFPLRRANPVLRRLGITFDMTGPGRSRSDDGRTLLFQSLVALRRRSRSLSAEITACLPACLPRWLGGPMVDPSAAAPCEGDANPQCAPNLVNLVDLLPYSEAYLGALSFVVFCTLAANRNRMRTRTLGGGRSDGGCRSSV